MQGQSRPSKRWRRFKRKYGGVFAVGFFVMLVLTLVGLLMWFLTDMDFRSRPTM